MSNWFSVSLRTVSEDKRSAVFSVENTTLEPQRVRTAAAAVEMAGAAPFDERMFDVEPTIFGLEPGEVRDVSVSLSEKAPKTGRISVRLRVEKADRTDDFVHGPGVELGVDPLPAPRIPPWVWFVIGGSVILAVVVTLLAMQACEPDCKGDGDCTSGFTCKEGACMCGNAESCPSGTPICYDAQCKADCTKPGAACSSGQYCDATAKVCLAGCGTDSDCSGGFSCKNHECKCGNAKKCAISQVCHDDQCRTACDKNKKCPTGQHCEDGACMPGCKAASDCATGFTCKSGTCYCGSAKSCSSNYVCFDDACRKKCTIPATCTGKSYCFEKTVCLPECNSTSDCPKGYKCNPTSKECTCASFSCANIYKEFERFRTIPDTIATQPIGTVPAPMLTTTVPHP